MSFTILLHYTTNGQMIPYSYLQRRNRIDRQSLTVQTLFPNGQMREGCWVAEWFIIFLAKELSSMADLGRRDH